MDKLAKEFVIKHSGHGSAYRYDGQDPRQLPPAEKWMTYEEAFKEADYWIGHACTIGGQAIIVHAPTLQEFDPYRGELTPCWQTDVARFGSPQHWG